MGSLTPRLGFCHGVEMFFRVFAIVALSLPLVAQQEPPQAAAAQPTGEKLAPYYPTPETVVERMLELGKLKAGKKMFDLGSGDGRIVIMAAQKYHADATGIELDPDLVQSSAAKIRQLGLQKTARIVYGDILKQNYSSANLITVYLLPESNLKVRPVLDAAVRKELN